MKGILSIFVIVFFLSLVESCVVAPSDSDIKGSIADYFERQHYRVVDLRIGKIEDLPLSQKTYMGTPGYVVEVPTITLEALEEKGFDIRKGTRLTFSNARIMVRQDTGDKRLWRVSIISGITVN
jgi:hypothetical protein